MTKYLYVHGIRIFDYTQFAEPLRDAIRQHAEALAQAQGLTIEFITKLKSFRKEERIQAIVQVRGTQPGLVHIFSAMEGCQAYQPWHDKGQGQTYVKNDARQMPPLLFLLHRCRSWVCVICVCQPGAPFRLQFYCNGHNVLASQLASRQA